jgi:hypothetical protein
MTGIHCFDRSIQDMVGNRNSYLPTPDGEFVFEHFLRIVDGSGIFHLNMPLYSKGSFFAD